MILTVGNVKGGVGKTTLAVNIAISRALAGRDVLLVDGDEQGTAVAFTDLRAGALGAPGYTAVILQGAALRTQVRQLAAKYDDIVIDVGGRDTGSLRVHGFVVRQHSDDRLAPAGVGDAGGGIRALGHQRFDLDGRPVVDGHLMARLQQARRHSGSHVSQPNKSDFHCLPPLTHSALMQSAPEPSACAAWSEPDADRGSI
jgi:hypothetical protein